MSILVTGGTGYIGSHTVAELLDAGFETGSSSCGREEFCALLDALLGELEPKIFKMNENGVNISGNNHCRPGKRVL